MSASIGGLLLHGAALMAMAAASLPLPSGRMTFLGDSITYSGQYVEYTETMLRTRFPEKKWDIIDIGLPSETVSGLSEPGHAGGKFPRPDLHERLDRVLAKSKPDWVFACYGMNDGIYYPLEAVRMAAHITGIQKLRDEVQAVGAKMVHLTPPTFDPVPIKGKTLPAGLDRYEQPYEGYDSVLTAYSEWLVSQRKSGWSVVDVHGPMSEHLVARRR
ncbi:MAG TPA: SGNH/GDSL hydrolase family protein, partial [Roseimicrobium sp.]|nr:SGNH/GDSL hydrolase family protein [Roseimicrobium sp.]